MCQYHDPSCTTISKQHQLDVPLNIGEEVMFPMSIPPITEACTKIDIHDKILHDSIHLGTCGQLHELFHHQPVWSEKWRNVLSRA